MPSSYYKEAIGICHVGHTQCGGWDMKLGSDVVFRRILGTQNQHKTKTTTDCHLFWLGECVIYAGFSESRMFECWNTAADVSCMGYDGHLS